MGRVRLHRLQEKSMVLPGKKGTAPVRRPPPPRHPAAITSLPNCKQAGVAQGLIFLSSSSASRYYQIPSVLGGDVHLHTIASHRRSTNFFEISVFRHSNFSLLKQKNKKKKMQSSTGERNFGTCSSVPPSVLPLRVRSKISVLPTFLRSRPGLMHLLPALSSFSGMEWSGEERPGPSGPTIHRLMGWMIRLLDDFLDHVPSCVSGRSIISCGLCLHGICMREDSELMGFCAS
ncbi:hypothetical protein ACLOJK_037299 [Asimina triloba]